MRQIAPEVRQDSGFLVNCIQQIEQEPNLKRLSARQELGQETWRTSRPFRRITRGMDMCLRCLELNGFGLETRGARVGWDRRTQQDMTRRHKDR